jgi:hypothetical protein
MAHSKARRQQQHGELREHTARCRRLWGLQNATSKRM